MGYAELNDIDSMMEASARRFLDERHPATVACRMAGDPAEQSDLWATVAQLGWPALLLPEPAGGMGQGLGAAWPLAVQAGRHLLTAPLVANMTLLQRLPAESHDGGKLAAWLEPVLTGSAAYAPAQRRPDGSLLVEYALAQRQALAWRYSQAGIRLELHGPCAGPAGVGIDPTVGSLRLAAGRPADSLDVSISDGQRAAWLQGYRLLRAAEMLGAAWAALDAAAAHARQRQQFGRAIGANQAVKHRLANDWMALDDAALAGKEAARLLDDAADEPAARACAVFELLALESAPRAAQHAIQLHGALGIAWESGMHLYLKRVLHIAAMLGGGRRRTELLDILWNDGGQAAAA